MFLQLLYGKAVNEVAYVLLNFFGSYAEAFLFDCFLRLTLEQLFEVLPHFGLDHVVHLIVVLQVVDQNLARVEPLPLIHVAPWTCQRWTSKLRWHAAQVTSLSEVQ